MPGKYEYRLQKARVVVTVAALAVVLVAYGLRHLFGG
jgi:hypothetical protein